MDEAQKAKIRLEHWINHNCDHLKGYLEVSNSLDTIGLNLIGDRIRNAVEYIDRANDEFRKALEQLEASSAGVSTSTGCCCSEHSHDHCHSHSHEHGHEQGHSHSHEHCHEGVQTDCREHPHERCHNHAHDHAHDHHDHHHGKSGHRHD